MSQPPKLRIHHVGTHLNFSHLRGTQMHAAEKLPTANQVDRIGSLWKPRHDRALDRAGVVGRPAMEKAVDGRLASRSRGHDHLTLKPLQEGR